MTHDIHKPGADLVPRIAAGESELLPQLFTLRTTHWKHPFQHDAFVTVGLFSDLEEATSPSAAFDLIPAAVAIVLVQTDADLRASAASLLLGLVRRSDTTEMPAALGSKWDEVCALLAGGDRHCGYYLEDLQKWYRRDEQP